MELIEKLIKGMEFTESDLINELYEICDRVHASCDHSCPVYALNNGSAVGTHKPFKENRGCDCFKNGKEMLIFIRNH